MRFSATLSVFSNRERFWKQLATPFGICQSEVKMLPKNGSSPMTDDRQPTTNKEVYFLMNNLTTRKIVLGLLMTLVLAFGVQGVAKAIDNPNANTVVANLTVVDSAVFSVSVSETIPSIILEP